jgi:hypothetical protein
MALRSLFAQPADSLLPESDQLATGGRLAFQPAVRPASRGLGWNLLPGNLNLPLQSGRISILLIFSQIRFFNSRLIGLKMIRSAVHIIGSILD